MAGQHTYEWLKQQLLCEAGQLSEELDLNSAGEREPCGRQFQLSQASWARLNGLSHTLNISADALLQQLIANAMGDAHDGFLAAFTDPQQREQANTVLKARVKALLSE